MKDNVALSTKIPPTALPRSEAAQLEWLRLVRSRRVGPATFIRLIREHGDAVSALDALPDIAARAGARGYSPAARQDIEAEWQASKAAGAVPLLLGAADYPPLLATIPDPPPFLWAVGTPGLAFERIIALVGARNASALGRRMTARLARDLGEAGFVIVSGLARGIDTAAHDASLGTGTIAVHAGGVDIVYPKQNAGLAEEIARQGLRLSEMPTGHSPRAKDFPRRNRIVSGLATGLVVVEGALKSGSLITARNALDQGREVMAVPGSPLDARAGGCNALIRNGAVLVRSAEDVLEALQELPVPRSTTQPAPDTGVEASDGEESSVVSAPEPAAGGDATEVLMSLLSPVGIAEDTLIRELRLPSASVSALLTRLEITGRIRRHPGGLVSLP